MRNIFSIRSVRLPAALLFVLITFQSKANAQSFLCPCLLRRECLPPPNALVICKQNGNLQFFDRNSMMTREARVADLLRRLRDESAAVRTNAATELAGIRPTSKEIEPALVEALRNDPSKWVRRAAARTLGRLRLRTAESALRTAVSDRDHWVAHSATEALKRIALRSQSDPL